MIDQIVPDWSAPANIRAMFTTRNIGAAENRGVYADLNLANHVDDDPLIVQQNRNQLRQYLPDHPRWLTQVHGSRPVWVDSDNNETFEADAAMSRCPGVVCAVLVADCLPVLLCDMAGSVVGIAHAGWRGLAGGIIENTVRELRKFSHSNQIIAWLGPAISARHFEVGDEVREIFTKYDYRAACAFLPGRENGKWYANLSDLARQRLSHVGINHIYGGDLCTFSNPEQFYSYRRDGKTGRMAGLLWIALPAEMQ